VMIGLSADARDPQPLTDARDPQPLIQISQQLGAMGIDKLAGGSHDHKR